MIEQTSETIEHVVQFKCSQHLLTGILHAPPNVMPTESKVGVVFINASVRSRRGLYGLYVRFARRLCQAGCYVLRYDPPGIGDSQGHLEDMAAYAKQMSERNENVFRAIDFVQRETQAETIGLVGLCAGAYGALVAAGAEPRVDFVVPVSLPVLAFRDLSQEALAGITVQGFLQRTTKWEAWWKFLTGKSNYKWLIRSVLTLSTGKWNSPRLDRKLCRAFDRVASRKGKVLFMYGSQDHYFLAFDKWFSRYLKRVDQAGDCHATQLVSGSNHVFSQSCWQEELIDTSIAWIEKVAGLPGQSDSKPHDGN